MKGKRVKKIFKVIYRMLLVLLVLLFYMTGIALFKMPQSIELSYNDTSIFSATIKDFKVWNSDGQDYSITIKTNEYDCSLMIRPDIFADIDQETISKLSAGEPIYFRVSNEKVDLLNSSTLVSMLYLKVNNSIIFSLEDYNRSMRNTCRTLMEQVLKVNITLLILNIVAWSPILVSLIKRKPKMNDNAAVTYPNTGFENLT